MSLPEDEAELAAHDEKKRFADLTGEERLAIIDSTVEAAIG
jgi:hypothetical protein